jgi:hypothetical protein
MPGGSNKPSSLGSLGNPPGGIIVPPGGLINLLGSLEAYTMGAVRVINITVTSNREKIFFMILSPTFIIWDLSKYGV